MNIFLPLSNISHLAENIFSFSLVVGYVREPTRKCGVQHIPRLYVKGIRELLNKKYNMPSIENLKNLKIKSIIVFNKESTK